MTVGNKPITAHFPVDPFSGDGSTVAFVMSQEAASSSSIQVTVGNVPQDPLTAYNVNGTTLTFTSPPVTGTNNIIVVHRGVSVQIPVPADLSVTFSKLALSHSQVRLRSENGHGSTNTNIRRFSTTVEDVGADITYTRSEERRGGGECVSRGRRCESHDKGNGR